MAWRGVAWRGRSGGREATRSPAPQQGAARGCEGLRGAELARAQALHTAPRYRIVARHRLGEVACVPLVFAGFDGDGGGLQRVPKPAVSGVGSGAGRSGAQAGVRKAGQGARRARAAGPPAQELRARATPARGKCEGSVRKVAGAASP